MPTNEPVTGWNGQMEEVQSKHFFAIWRLGQQGQTWEFNYLLMGSLWPLFNRYSCKTRQKIHNVTPGATYNITFNHELSFDTIHRSGSKRPSFNVYSRSGAALSNNVYSNGFNEQQESVTVVATDDVLIIEWVVPQHLSDPVTWKAEWSYTQNDYTQTLQEWDFNWLIRNPSVHAV